jgi:hypothetical protein
MALPGIKFGEGINIESGIKAGTFPAVPTLALSLDAATYSGSGAWIDSVGSRAFVLYGSPTWSSSIGGGSFLFDPAFSQYAQCASSLGSLNNWSVEVWHYYDGTNDGGASPCIITEVYPGATSNINYALGSVFDNDPVLSAAFFNGAWRSSTTTTLTAGNWYQIVGTYDGATVKLYVNGSMVGESPEDTAAISSQGGINLMRRWDNPEFWGGFLASVKIWDGDINFEGVQGSWLKNKSRYGL